MRKIFHFILIILGIGTILFVLTENAEAQIGVTLYDGWYFGEPHQTYTSNAATLPANLNDKVTSIKISSGYTVTVYEDANWGGVNHTTFTGNQLNLTFIHDGQPVFHLDGWNDKISSIKVTAPTTPPTPYCGDGSCNGTENCTSCPYDCDVCPPYCGDGSCNGTENCTSCSQDCGACPLVTLYDAADYITLWPYTYKTFPSGNYSDLSSYSLDNIVSSIRIPSGYYVTIYAEKSYVGPFLTLTSDNPNLFTSSNPTGWNDRISSIKVSTTVPPPPPPPPPVGVTLYDAADYGGAWYHLTSLNYSDLNLIGWNDIVSSIKISSGYYVTVYENVNHGGSHETFTSDIANLYFQTSLYPGGWNDKISSIKVSTSPPEITLYDAAYYSVIGSFKTFTSGDYSDLVSWDNIASSIKIPSGLYVTIYAEKSYGGPYLTLTSDTPNLYFDPSGWDNRISSIKVSTTPPPTPPPPTVGVTLYDAADYGGAYYHLTSSEYSDLSLIGWDNIVSSIKISSGYNVTIYGEKNYVGASTTLTTSTANLLYIGISWNDLISSIKVSTTTTTTPICGNGLTESGEQCDDGGSNNGACPATCSASCTTNSCGGTPSCGNGLVESGEQCDDGGSNNGACPATCSTSCTTNSCGDGTSTPGKIIRLQNPLNATSFEELVNNLINFIFYLALAITPLMIIIAGVQYVTAGGDPNKIQTAQKIILYTVIGLVIILLAKALIYVLQGVLGG